MNLRIGQGLDVHAFAEGRPLILGGINIPHTFGLSGHSDADVLTHTVCDAILGGAGLGDIGRHFPDTDPRYKDADSIGLLQAVVAMASEGGWRIVNIDATVVAQEPKLAPYIPDMTSRLAIAMGIDASQVNIKATTSEYLGFTGRKQGMAAFAVALLGQSSGG